ncbi:MAG TPA: UDP-glucose/GDP-mannose dehydrogenase family protein [Vitreimonas sp.]|nr:UDP-glucose/GDP-mannose dehydrogenase family protein [Vitreimonas sp.]
MNITIIGTGFVGVVSAAVYASFGHTVVGLDIDEKKVQSLRQGKVPFYEPNLETLLLEQQAKGHLSFTTDYQQAITTADIIFIAVGTPSAADGQADMKFVFSAATALAPHLKPEAIVVVKSTVPPGSLDKVADVIKQARQESGAPELVFHMASVPEFLREGSAVHDTLNPDRIVLGATEASVFDRLETLHKPLNAPVVKVSPSSAQMAKYAANAYLATRITFINQIADLCQKNQADVQEVIQAIGYDQRIGSHYWYPGFGYGGSCFPKDVKELAAYSRSVNEPNNLFNKINELNEERIPRLMNEYDQKIGGWQGKKVAVLGLSFKPNTDDMREAPSLRVIPHIVTAGGNVTGFDPKALEVVKYFMPDQKNVTYTTDLAAACADADVILALIEWPEIVSYDFSKVKRDQPQWFIDARNQFSPQTVSAWGYQYIGVGRSL